ncbi:uncharacterized protein BX664DRAFT_339255 [Halteromyces radiatus]|uniref:uncharacterized protein n=1 Tax=Halteromyces radiatus TaxID=101107 RepID=UPI00221E7BAF|nr:uncharacterized protein BX664DRAFT_339255 [Halteromyces radiatus]KAI8082865.1 hypothetical protein BX664DRAFT_339255 [Halteromyces radiatus]
MMNDPLITKKKQPKIMDLYQNLFPLDTYATLDTEIYDLYKKIGEELVNEQSLVDNEVSPESSDDNTNKSSSSTIVANPKVVSESLDAVTNPNIYDNKFFQPTVPFQVSVEDAEQLLNLVIPPYLQKLKQIKDLQEEVQREEVRDIIPLVIQVLHAYHSKPNGRMAKETYIESRSGLMRRLFRNNMTRYTFRTFAKKVCRLDDW